MRTNVQTPSSRRGERLGRVYDRAIDPRRRALLLIAAVLGTSMIAASLVGTPQRTGRPGEGGRDTAGDRRGSGRAEARPGRARERTPARTVRLRFDVGAEMPQTRRLRRGERAIVTVQVPVPGEVGLRGLGRMAFADPRTPASFDLLPDRAGRFSVTFSTAERPARRAGTLVVGER
jgi:hypothetical protein